MKVLSQHFFSPVFQPIQGLHLVSKYSIIYLLEKIMYSTSSWSFSLPLSIYFPACDLLVANWSLALNPPPLAYQANPSPTLLAQPSHLLFTYRSLTKISLSYLPSLFTSFPINLYPSSDPSSSWILMLFFLDLNHSSQNQSHLETRTRWPHLETRTRCSSFASSYTYNPTYTELWGKKNKNLVLFFNSDMCSNPAIRVCFF